MTKIPGFRTEQETREFWDAHDSAEYFEDMNDDGAEIIFNQVGVFWSFLCARDRA